MKKLQHPATEIKEKISEVNQLNQSLYFMVHRMEVGEQVTLAELQEALRKQIGTTYGIKNILDDYTKKLAEYFHNRT